VPASEIGNALGQAVEAMDSAPLLASVARDAHLEAPALESLAALVEGRIEPEQWTATMIADQAPPQRHYPRRVTKARL
jgi:glycerol-3-phosphate dehydrogenase (NAD(P)+)